MVTDRNKHIPNDLDVTRLDRLRTPKQASIWPSVVVSATAMLLLSGCVAATDDAASAPLTPSFIAAAVGLVMVWVFMVKATAAVMVALMKITKALAELTAVVASFLGAAAVAGAGLALVTWVTLN